MRGAGYIQNAVKVEVGDGAGFRRLPVEEGRLIEVGLAEGAIALVQQDHHPSRGVGYDQVLLAVIAQVGDLHIHDFTASGAVGDWLEEFAGAVVQKNRDRAAP